MNNPIKVFINKKSVILFLAVIIGILGSCAYYMLPRQESPDVSVPIAMIITPYPGATAQNVNDLVTKKLEDELYKISGYDYTDSISKEGLSIISVVFEFDVDADKAIQDVRNAVADAKHELPLGAMDSILKTDLLNTAGMIISLSGENYSYEQLASYGERFKESLTSIDGITKFDIEGEISKEVKIELDIPSLNQLSISVEDIYNIIRSQNIEIPSGDIDTDSGKIVVKTPGVYTSIKDIENTIINVSPQTGAVTRLNDVADIYMDLESDVVKYKQNGKNAVLLSGYFKEAKNVVLVGKDVRKTLEEVKQDLPEDLIVEEVIYQPDDVSASVNDFMLSLLEGIIFVIIVVLIGMGLRNAVVVSATIPLSILITFGVMYVSKIYIHQMSLTAMIVALGVLVDNAIVISDTIQARIDNGLDRITASYEGTASSAIPIFTATLTTVAAFSPLLGLSGAAGKFLIAIPQVLIISIIAAYIVSMTVTPAMAASFFTKSKKKKVKESKLKNIFSKSLDFGLNNKWLTVGMIFVIFIIVIKVFMPMLPSQFFPFADKDTFYIDMNSERVGDMEATEKFTDDVVNLLSTIPEISSYTVSIGDGIPKFYISVMPATPSQDFSQMLIKFDLKDSRFKNREDFAKHLQNSLDRNISGGKCTVNILQLTKPGAKVVVKVSGENMDNLMDKSNEIKTILDSIQGTINVRDDLKDRTYQYEVEIDEDRAMSYGISKYDVQRQINIALYGAKPSAYRRDGNEYLIVVKSNIGSISELENLSIKSSIVGNKIPLKQFATIKLGSKIDSINRFDRKQTVTIESDVAPNGDAVYIETALEEEISKFIDTEGINITYDGERELINDNFSEVGVLALFAIFIIYVILVIQFNSFIQPLVIMITVPLSLIGSILGLYLFKQPLSLTAFLGIIALIGLVVKNGILLIEYINIARRDGLTIDEACKDAVEKRYNAIVLSAGTTIMGLLPLALGGSSLFAPMAIALMAGLLVSTFLTMVVIPVIYSMIENQRESKRAIKNN